MVVEVTVGRQFFLSELCLLWCTLRIKNDSLVGMCALMKLIASHIFKIVMLKFGVGLFDYVTPPTLSVS